MEKFKDEYIKPICSLAKDVYGKEYVCGKNCPAYKNCPQLIMENVNLEIVDIMDESYRKAISDAREAMMQMLKEAGK